MAEVEATIRETVQVLGMSFPRVSALTADGYVGKNVSVPIAKVGQLTTRTDNNTGELTMAASHGITTGARLDLYWSGGMRRGITVGTVATNAVPIDLGSGDNLPANLTAITAMVPVEEAFAVTGADAAAIFVFSDKAGQITFCEADETEAKTYAVGGASGGEQSDFWTPDRDADNPLDTFDVTKVYFSHGSTDAAAKMRALVLFN